jgi:hypothetical protein
LSGFSGNPAEPENFRPAISARCRDSYRSTVSQIFRKTLAAVEFAAALSRERRAPGAPALAGAGAASRGRKPRFAAAGGVGRF